MKWFEHECDALENPKIKQIINEFGHTGYLICFGTWEKIGKYGDKFLRLGLEKYPKTLLADAFSTDIETMERVWTSMTKKGLLSPKHLKNNVLYSSKLKERCDQYQRKLRRKSVQGTDNVSLEENTIDKKRIDKIRDKHLSLQNLSEIVLPDKDLLTSYYKRNGKVIARLLKITRNDSDLVCNAMEWVSGVLGEKGLVWTLETVEKWFPKYLLREKEYKEIPESLKKFVKENK